MHHTPTLPFAVLVFAAVLLGGCANPPPTCSAADRAYTICADDQVWECPVATSEQLAAKQVLTDACNSAPDKTKCILDTKYEMFEMTLKAKCAEAGQVCVASMGAGAQSASCQMK